MSGPTARARARMLAAEFSGPLWLSVHSADPGERGSHEAPASRVAVTANDPVGGYLTLPTLPAEVELPEGRWSHWGLWSDAVGGEFKCSGTLRKPRVTDDGDALRFRPGSLSIRTVAA